METVEYSVVAFDRIWKKYAGMSVSNDADLSTLDIRFSDTEAMVFLPVKTDESSYEVLEYAIFAMDTQEMTLEIGLFTEDSFVVPDGDGSPVATEHYKLLDLPFRFSIQMWFNLLKKYMLTLQNHSAKSPS